MKKGFAGKPRAVSVKTVSPRSSVDPEVEVLEVKPATLPAAALMSEKERLQVRNLSLNQLFFSFITTHFDLCL